MNGDRCRLACFLDDGDGLWTRDIDFPCFPYPGLLVGSMRVRTVSVCQGDLDGDGDIEVELERCHSEPMSNMDYDILREQGWKRS